MTWLRASGAIVATYWSVFVTVRMAHTEITEIGMSSDARTTSTQAEIRLARGRGAPAWDSPVSRACPRPCRRASRRSPCRSFLHAHPPMPSAKWP